MLTDSDENGIEGGEEVEVKSGGCSNLTYEDETGGGGEKIDLKETKLNEVRKDYGVNRF